MKKWFLIALILFTAPLFAMTANGAEAGKGDAGKAVVEQPVPVQVLGKTIEIRKGMTRADAKQALSAVIKEEPSLDTAERLQYDVALVPNEAPVSITFDFDKKGIVNGFMLDAMSKKQNPPAVKLLEWLKANAGEPRVKKKGSAMWNFGGWKIEHVAGGSGEDAAYRVEFTAAK
ncbi:MAG: hypothetical protein ABFD97_12925 [Syntrophobacter sp.]